MFLWAAAALVSVSHKQRASTSKWGPVFLLQFNLPYFWILFPQQNQPDAPISQIHLWNQTLHVSDSSSVHHQQFFAVHTAMVYVIQVCWQLVSRIRTERSSFLILYDLYHCCVYSETDDGQRNCPKHVEFYSKNKFEKLVYLVGFIVRTTFQCLPQIKMACVPNWGSMRP